MEREGHSEPSEMTFFEHLDALRPHLVRGVSAMLVIAVFAFFFKHFIIDYVLFGPSSPDFITNRLLCRLGRSVGIEAMCVNQAEFLIVNTRMAGQFNLHMTVSIVTALAIAVPYLLWELWRFVSPALSYQERRKSSKFVLYISLCFFTGLLFGYYVIAPITVSFLTGYNASGSIVNMIDVTSYLSTVLTVSLSCALIFQLPVLIYFLSRMGVVKSRFLRKYRKHAIVVMFILSAVITPPDLFSQILVALPLILLYEFSIKIAVKNEKRQQAEEAAFATDSATED